MKTIRLKTIGLSIALASLGVMLPTACSTNDELETPSGQTISNTRSVLSDYTQQTLSESEAVVAAKDILHISSEENLTYSITYVKAQKEESKSILPSEIIAYVVNFPAQDYSAIVSSIRVANPVIAYSTQGLIRVSNGRLENPLYKGVEDYVVSLSQKGFSHSSITNTPLYGGCIGHDHYVIRHQIKTKVHTGSPFNQDVLKEHPNCHAGSVPTCCATAVEYTGDTLIYKKCEYDFPAIKYCLEQGPGFFPHILNNKIDLNIDDINLKFIYSYDGAVSATSKLIADFGKDMYTSYSKENSTTYLSDAYRALEKLGFKLSPFRSQFSEQDVWELLDAGYIVIQEGFERGTGRKTCILITGGENIYSGGDKLHAEGVHFNVYYPDDPENNNFTSLCAEYLEDYCLTLKQYFGIKYAY